MSKKKDDKETGNNKMMAGLSIDAYRYYLDLLENSAYILQVFLKQDSPLNKTLYGGRFEDLRNIMNDSLRIADMFHCISKDARDKIKQSG